MYLTVSRKGLGGSNPPLSASQSENSVVPRSEHAREIAIEFPQRPLQVAQPSHLRVAGVRAFLNSGEYGFILAVDGVIPGLCLPEKYFPLLRIAVGQRSELRGAKPYDRMRHIDRLRIQPDHLVRHDSNEVRGKDARHPDVMKVLMGKPRVETFGERFVITAEALGEPGAVNIVALAASHHGDSRRRDVRLDGGLVNVKQVITLHRVFRDHLPVCIPYFTLVDGGVHLFEPIVRKLLIETAQARRQRLGLVIESHTYEAGPDFNAQFRQATFLPIKPPRLLHIRRTDQLPVQIVGPGVIRALKRPGVPTVIFQAGPSMATDSRERADLPAMPAHHQERFARDLETEVVPLVRNLVHPAGEEPLAPENAVEFTFQQGL